MYSIFVKYVFSIVGIKHSHAIFMKCVSFIFLRKSVFYNLYETCDFYLYEKHLFAIFLKHLSLILFRYRLYLHQFQKFKMFIFPSKHVYITNICDICDFYIFHICFCSVRQIYVVFMFIEYMFRGESSIFLK